MSIEEYYATNYSKCNITYSFLASWRGLAYSCHIIQPFALIIQIFTFYIIMKHTPTLMKMMKSPLLFNHFCCCLLDFLICTMATPYIFLHNISILGLGVFSWLGVSPRFQLGVGASSAFLACCSYIYVFETRSSSLPMNRFKMTRKWVRGLYHLLLYLISYSIIPILHLTPDDQVAAKLESLNFDPCPTKEFFDVETFILSTDLTLIYFGLFFTPVLILHANAHLLFHVICTVYYLYIAPNKTISRETNKNQKQFFINCLFQTSIPTGFIAFIVGFLCFDTITHSLSQKMINFGMILCATHGILESITILLVHRSYRDAVWKIISSRGSGVSPISSF